MIRITALFATVAVAALSACNPPAETPDDPAAMETSVPATTASPASAPATVPAPDETAAQPARPDQAGPAVDACGASRVAPFVAKEATPAVRAEIAAEVGHDRIRWLDPDAVITMDFRSDRLNVMLDNAGIITGAKCQ